MGSLYLGCKLAETPRRVQDFVYLFSFLEWLCYKDKCAAEQLCTQSPEEASESLESLEASFVSFFHEEQQKPEFRHRKTNLHRIERHILRETAFRICEVLTHPHRSTIQYIHCLFSGVVQEEWRHFIVRYAWGYLNDALRLPLCCMFQPTVLTTAAIYLAVQDNGVTLPHNDDWLKLFDVTLEDMMSVVTSMKSLYTSKTPEYRVLANPPVPPPSHLLKSCPDKHTGDIVKTPYYGCLDTSTHMKDEMKDRIDTQLNDIEERHSTQ